MSLFGMSCCFNSGHKECPYKRNKRLCLMKGSLQIACSKNRAALVAGSCAVTHRALTAQKGSIRFARMHSALTVGSFCRPTYNQVIKNIGAESVVDLGRSCPFPSARTGSRYIWRRRSARCFLGTLGNASIHSPDRLLLYLNSGRDQKIPNRRLIREINLPAPCTGKSAAPG
jgi:hypothetical protein